MKSKLTLFAVAIALGLSSCNKQDFVQPVETLTGAEQENVSKYTDNVLTEVSTLLNQKNIAAYYAAHQNEIESFLGERNYSTAYRDYMSAIRNSGGFSSPSEYGAHVIEIKGKVLSDNRLSSDEKKSVLIMSETVISFVNKADQYFSSYATIRAVKAANPRGNVSKAAAAEESWWDSWGKCAAGIIGGAGLGGLGGATVTSPTVIGIPVGVAVGVVAGGLSGAAASC